ncbi:diacylglycerol kinase family protein [Eupransor demetentiae]|uniref:Diacylglycerol kinase (DgkA) n=1 Tax=Eupransor demetentiae TaxID=3109584 RepID=A0ABM9N3X7_9LACO|nr:Diacylglycerol kinase (DgkA) [Lactobacillaceae bacterium LMG 33000]
MTTDSRDKQHQITRNHSLAAAIKNSWNGIWTVIRRERNMRIHIAAALVIGIAALFDHLKPIEWLPLIAAITLVICLEFVNTIVEALVDLIVGHHYDIKAGLAKDVAAGLVSFAVFIELLVVAIVFWSHFKG